MDPAVITALITGAVALTSTIIGAVGTDKANQENIALQEKANAENLDLAKNGISYKVADAEKNGFSPLAALGANGLQSGIVSAPQVKSADYSGLSNFASGAFSSLLQKSTAENQLSETKRHNITTETLEEQRNDISKLNIDMNVRDKMLELNNALKIARENNASQESINKARMACEALLQDNTFKHDLIMQDNTLKKQAENLEKSLKSARGNTWINGAFGTLNTIISTVGNIFGRGGSGKPSYRGYNEDDLPF